MRTDTIIIGGGQAGLAMGYHLARRGREFVILDAAPRVGHIWRNRWDSLALFTPAFYSALPGMPFAGDPHRYPGKEEVADYLEAYAARFRLPVHAGSRWTHFEPGLSDGKRRPGAAGTRRHRWWWRPDHSTSRSSPD